MIDTSFGVVMEQRDSSQSMNLDLAARSK